MMENDKLHFIFVIFLVRILQTTGNLLTARNVFGFHVSQYQEHLDQ